VKLLVIYGQEVINNKTILQVTVTTVRSRG